MGRRRQWEGVVGCGAHSSRPPPFPSPQLPSQITWGDCETKGTLPGEVAGWLAGLLQLTKGEWVLVLSDERWLAAQLTIRGPLPLNVVWGCTDGTPGTRERLQVLCEDLKSAMVVLSRQTKPRYGQPEARHPEGGRWVAVRRTHPPILPEAFALCLRTHLMTRFLPAWF